VVAPPRQLELEPMHRRALAVRALGTLAFGFSTFTRKFALLIACYYRRGESQQ
jgi:hypothetical protein